jgi:hypothetical protein
MRGKTQLRTPSFFGGVLGGVLDVRVGQERFAGDLAPDVFVITGGNLALGELAEDRPQQQGLMGNRVFFNRDFYGEPARAGPVKDGRKTFTGISLRRVIESFSRFCPESIGSARWGAKQRADSDGPGTILAAFDFSQFHG